MRDEMREIKYELDLGAFGIHQVEVVFDPAGPVVDSVWIDTLVPVVPMDVFNWLTDKAFDEIVEACANECRRIRENRAEMER